jgi:hypothetical protein
MPFVVVGRDLGTRGLELSPVAKRAVADEQARRKLCRGEAARLAVDDREDLAPTRVDHGDRSRGAGCERLERRHTCYPKLEREGHRPCGRDAQAHPGEASGADPDGDRSERARVVDQPVDGGVDLARRHSRLCERLAVTDECRCRGRRRGVEGEDQHDVSLVLARTLPPR